MENKTDGFKIVFGLLIFLGMLSLLASAGAKFFNYKAGLIVAGKQAGLYPVNTCLRWETQSDEFSPVLRSYFVVRQIGKESYKGEEFYQVEEKYRKNIGDWNHLETVITFRSLEYRDAKKVNCKTEVAPVIDYIIKFAETRGF